MSSSYVSLDQRPKSSGSTDGAERRLRDGDDGDDGDDGYNDDGETQNDDDGYNDGETQDGDGGNGTDGDHCFEDAVDFPPELHEEAEATHWKLV